MLTHLDGVLVTHLDGVLETHLDGVLQHGVVQLAESEAKAAAHLCQADCELTNRRPVISAFKHCLFSPYFSFLFLAVQNSSIGDLVTDSLTH